MKLRNLDSVNAIKVGDSVFNKNDGEVWEIKSILNRGIFEIKKRWKNRECRMV